MNNKRLDLVANRQKKNLVVDTLFAAVLVVGLGLAALALWVRLPSLPVQPAHTPASLIQVEQTPAQATASILDSRPEANLQL